LGIEELTTMEKIRALVRRQVGWDTRLYRSFAFLVNWGSVAVKESLWTLFELLRLSSPNKLSVIKPVSFRKLLVPFYLRAGTKDVSVAINNFVREEYAAIKLVQNPKIMVDAGAYVGDTAAYFLSEYPNLTCFAYEPMTESYDVAAINLSPYGHRAHLFRKAVAGTDGIVKVAGTQTGAFISDSDGEEIEAISIESIIKSLPEPQIDILKLDVEGSEVDIFRTNAEFWLPRTKGIIVETHSEEGTRIVLEILRQHAWTAERVRNLYFCAPS